MDYCECGGLAGYKMEDSQLICANCGGLSPKSVYNGSQFVPLGDKKLTCPNCGHIVQEARAETKVGPELEDKMGPATTVKRIVPRGTRKLKPKRR